MRALILLHRWLGVAFCLLFAMWFASGIVMHFVPFPALTETERAGGLAAINVAAVVHGPADAVAAGKIKDATRVRLLQRPDGPVYLVSGLSGVVALRAADLADAAVRAPPLALAIATDYARRRGLDFTDATVAGLASYDQWTVSGGFDPHRPLYRIALDDGPGTELYVSSRTGEVVTRHDTLAARLELSRQRRALDLSDGVAQPSGSMELAGMVALAPCFDRSERGRHCRHTADRAPTACA